VTKLMIARLTVAAWALYAGAAYGAPMVSFPSSVSNGDESSSPVDVEVVLSEISAGTVTVDYAAIGGTATGTGRGADYNLVAGTLTFDPGDLSKNLSFFVSNDGNQETDETVVIGLSGVVGGSLGSPSQHTYTILDNDGPLDLSFDKSDSSGAETFGLANIPVRLSQVASQTVTVQYAVTGGSATGGGVDYSLPAGTLTFPVGELVQYIPVTLVDDGVPDASETVEITLSSPTVASLGTITQHTLAILDEAGAALATVRVTDGLEKPLLVTAPPGDCDRLFIVGQEGTIQIMKQGEVAGVATLDLLPTPFLDITSLVSDTNLISHGRSEQGLLSLAFDPNYAANGYFYVHYTKRAAAGQITPGDSVIARFSVTGDPDLADPNSEHKIIVISNTSENHNSGMIAFSPNDSYLYATIGIHSGSGPEAQNPLNIRGKLLRLDVHGDDFPGDPDTNYAIPPTNPFVSDGGVLDEIWSLGLRNPWRFSIDSENGDIYISDVGGGDREEVSYSPGTSGGGENYGFNMYEGSYCLNGPCDPTGKIFPIVERVRPNVTKEAAIGGYVYRGTRIPGLAGTYFHGDWWVDFPTGSCSPSGPSKFWSLRMAAGVPTQIQDRTAEFDPGGGMLINNLTSFGEDAAGNVYICSRGDINTPTCPRPRLLGEIYKIVADGDPDPLRICPVVAPTPTPAVTPLGALAFVLLLVISAAVVITRRWRPAIR